MFVREVVPRLIRDSRGERTIEIELDSYEGNFKCSAPTGKSRGRSEVEPWSSKGIGHSFKMLKVFCRSLKHRNFMIKEVDDLKEVVGLMRKFEARHGKFGGNVNYIVEGVFLKAAAAWRKKELWEFINDDVNGGLKPKMPMPVGNCIGGGLHSRFVDGKRPDFQEFLLIPKEKSFARAVTLNLRAYEFARKLLGIGKKDDEGAWMTKKTNEEVLEILQKLGKKFGVRIGVDVAASTFYDKGYYMYKNKNLIRDKVDQADYIERLVKKFGIFYVEDGMNEGDFSGFKEIVNNIGKNVLVVGDDLTTTNLKLVRRAVEGKVINAMIVKPNQIGSILEVKRVVEFCKKNKIVMIFSHRSGETMDDILADYCVGFGGQFIKCGIWGKERLIKLRRVIEIERSLK
ncbi:MAG: hypothetical protein V1889_02625 [archaeon]